MIDIIKGTDIDVTSSPKEGSKAGFVVALFLVALAAAGGGYWVKTIQSKPAPAVDLKAVEQAVKDADAQWSKAATARSLDVVLSYYSGDAVVLPPNAEMLTSKGDITKAWMTLLDPANTISWTPMYVEVAQSGEMVYDVGSYTMVTKPKKGKPETDHGKYLSVWKKQADGSWKAVADTWNSDLLAKK
jgi:ketosteroid isomerase-like protein